ncbi:hypothetical protein ACIA8R_33425 [Nonomuraea sp. NPDC051191]|uniref:hypothetical protein n=1 Tax=Nonomuraea sp. NPDC051191 TaxID=3364372 RepID=UPI00379A8EDF
MHERKRLGRSAAELPTIAEDLEPPTGPVQGLYDSSVREGGRSPVSDDMIAYARSLRARGVPVPDIARKLLIPTGKNKGHNSPTTRRAAAGLPGRINLWRNERSFDMVTTFLADSKGNDHGPCSYVDPLVLLV